MRSPSIDALRVALHLIAASVWVGGQIALVGVVRAARKTEPQPVVLTAIARGFASVAWPALVVTVVTGVWNVFAVDVVNTDSAYQATLLVKLLMVAVTGIAAAVHSFGKSLLAKALGGALGLLSALAAMYLGVLLTV